MRRKGEIVNTFAGGKLEWEKKKRTEDQYLRLLRGSRAGLIIRSGTDGCCWRPLTRKDNEKLSMTHHQQVEMSESAFHAV